MTEQGAITHAFGWQLDKGRVRENNQDSLGAAKVKLVSEDANRSLGLYMVADGVAGSHDGDQASKLAVQTAMEEMLGHINRQETEAGIMEALHEAASSAHRTIRLQSSEDRQRATTLLMAAVIGDHAYLVNVGDSRAYLIREGQMRQITTDQTVAQALADNGLIEPDAVEQHPFRNVLAQAIGVDEIEGDSYKLNVEIGDQLLLCSDGLSGYLSQEVMLGILAEHGTPQTASEALVQAANDAGGRDNIAVIVVRVHERDA